MNKKLKKLMLVMITVLLLAACGPLQTTPTIEPVDVSDPSAESIPTVPSDGLAPEKYSKYIGINYPPLPDGLSEDVGMIIQDSNDYSLSLISDGEYKMLWLSKLTHHDANGNAFWEVKDILELSDVVNDVNLVLDGCLLNGVPDSEIFVLGKNGKILNAWRANTVLNVFEVMPISDIECHSDKDVRL